MLPRFPFARRLASYALAAFAYASIGAQAPKPAAETPQNSSATTTLSLDARLVNLPVIVRDKKGALVQNLTKDSFNLMVDNHPETIRYFDKDKDLPLTVGLLVDVSQSVRNSLEEERTASSKFLDQMLTAPEGRPPDRAFIIQFAHETELLQDLTSSRPKLQAAIKELGSTNPNAPRDQDNDPDNGGGRPGGGRRGQRGTTLYDAVFLSADEIMSKQKERKAVILLTDGVDSGSKESLNRCIEAAQRGDTVVYAIYFKGNEQQSYQRDDRRGGGFPGGGRGGGYPGGGYPGGGGGYPRGGGQQPQGGGANEIRTDGKKVLDRITGETGGRMFEVSKKQDVAAIYDQIAEELRSQYRLAFTPDAAILEDGYHQIDLTLPKDKSLKIQTRDGYYTGKP
jgi:VWFA-related protein